MVNSSGEFYGVGVWGTQGEGLKGGKRVVYRKGEPQDKPKGEGVEEDRMGKPKGATFRNGSQRGAAQNNRKEE